MAETEEQKEHLEQDESMSMLLEYEETQAVLVQVDTDPLHEVDPPCTIRTDTSAPEYEETQEPTGAAGAQQVPLNIAAQRCSPDFGDRGRACSATQTQSPSQPLWQAHAGPLWRTLPSALGASGEAGAGAWPEERIGCSDESSDSLRLVYEDTQAPTSAAVAGDKMNV